jgi:hypothetical protein
MTLIGQILLGIVLCMGITVLLCFIVGLWFAMTGQVNLGGINENDKEDLDS